jgi:heme/copper-type cytochrome/quinol oxidase subunit 2
MKPTKKELIIGLVFCVIFELQTWYMFSQTSIEENGLWIFIVLMIMCVMIFSLLIVAIVKLITKNYRNDESKKSDPYYKNEKED